jgi:hypothetical protein
MLYTKAKKAISIIIIQVDYRAVPYNGGFIVGVSHPTKPCLLGAILFINPGIVYIIDY